MKKPAKRSRSRAKAQIREQAQPQNNKLRELLTGKAAHFVLLFLIFLFSYPYIFDVKLDLNGDNFNYLNFADSIVKGKGYASPYSPDYAASNWYPPGYSALLALFMLVLGKSVVLLKILNGLLFLGTGLLVYAIADKVAQNKALAFSVAALLLLNSGLLRYATILMSEIPYMFFTALAFYFIVSMKEEAEKQFWKSRDFYFIVLAVVITYYFRSIGITLAAALVGHWVLSRKWLLTGGFIGGFFVLYLPWVIRNSIHGLEGRYLGTVMAVNPWRPEEGQISSVGEFVDKMIENFNETVIKGFVEVLFPFMNVQEMSMGILMILGLLIIGVALFGSWKMEKFRFLFGLYILGNIGILLIWHTGNGSRYVWPMMPFIAFPFFYGLFELIRMTMKGASESLVKSLPYGLLVFGLLAFPKLKELNTTARQDYPPAFKNYFEIARQVKSMNNDQLMVICRKPGIFYFFSDTYVANYKYSLDDNEVIQDMREKNADYVVLEQLGYGSTGRYLYPAINKHPELFQTVTQLKNPDTYLLKFNK